MLLFSRLRRIRQVPEPEKQRAAIPSLHRGGSGHSRDAAIRKKHAHSGFPPALVGVLAKSFFDPSEDHKKELKRWDMDYTKPDSSRGDSSFFSSFLWCSCLRPSTIPPRQEKGRLIKRHCLRRRDGITHGFPKAVTRSANAAEAM
jgi:hypothetical protein